MPSEDTAVRRAVRTAAAPLPFALLEPRRGYRFGPENRVLPDLLGRGAAEHVVDLGAGCGVLGLFAAHVTGGHVTLVERQEPLAALAQQNAAQFGERARVLCADLRDTPLPDADLVVANPPFFGAEEGRLSSNETTRNATHARHGGVDDFVRAARACLIPDGALWLVYPADRVAIVVEAFTRHGLILTDVAWLHARHTGGPYRAWLRGVRAGAATTPLRSRSLSVCTAR